MIKTLNKPRAKRINLHPQKNKSPIEGIDESQNIEISDLIFQDVKTPLERIPPFRNF